MGDKTAISWTDATWNPIRGCSRVSEGCRNCYAERVAMRFSGPGQPYEGLATIGRGWTREVRMVPEHLADPLRWRKPRRIFVNSMSDLFHESLTNEQIAAVFGVMAAAPQHTFQVLTKRARRMREWMREWFEWLAERAENIARDFKVADGPWPLPNVWLGVSVENQGAADERIPELLATPAVVRFISAEPLLGQVDLRRQLGVRTTCKDCGEDVRVDEDGCCTTCGRDALHYGLDWVIAGCESGPGARPCDVEWLRSLRDQCEGAGVPFFLKQANATYETNETSRVALDEDSGDDPVRVRGVDAGHGSKRKSGGVIELPYLDGVQHAAFPTISND